MKKVLKRVISMVMTTALILVGMNLSPLEVKAATNYEIWIGTTQVTSDNASDVLSDGTVSYDESTKTLYLNGLEFKANTMYDTIYNNSTAFGSWRGAVAINQDVTINVTGVNSVTGPDNCASPVGMVLGNSCSTVKFEGNGELSVIGGYCSSDAHSTVGIVACKNTTGIIIDGATINAIGGEGRNSSYGISKAQVTVNSGKLKAIGGYVPANPGRSYGFSYSYGETGLTVNGGEVEGIGGPTTYESYGISGGSVTINNNALLTLRADSSASRHKPYFASYTLSSAYESADGDTIVAASDDTIKVGYFDKFTESGSSVDIDVWGYTSADSETVYSVDVEWGAMTFRYVTDVYDPETHTTVEAAEKGWAVYDSIEKKIVEGKEDNINKIAVTNHSNKVVYSTFTYTSASGYEDTTGKFAAATVSDGTAFTDVEGLVPAYITLDSAATTQAAQVGNVYFVPVGIKEGYNNSNYTMWTKLGKITVSVGDTQPVAP